MDLLDTFAILFQTDAKKAADDVEDLNENLDDTKKSADGASDGMDGFKKSTSESNAGISTMIKKIGSLIATYLALDKTIDTAMENAEKVDVIGKFAQVTGQSIVNIDAWGQAVARNDGSAESFRGTLEYLNESLADISLTGGGEAAEMLARLGINAFDAGGKVKSAFAILPEIADAFQKLSTTQSFQFGRKLGLDMGTILTLQQGRVAVEKLVERQKSLGAVTKENYKISAKFDDQVDDTKRAFESLSTEATTELLPALTGILKILEYGIQWLRHNKSLVQGYFIGIAGVVAVSYIPAIIKAIKVTRDLGMALKLLGKGGIIGIVISAIALLYEDIKAWVNGSSSEIGDLLGSFENFKASVFKIFDDISKKFTGWLDEFKSFGKSVDDFFGFGDEKDFNIAANSKMAMDLIGSYNSNPLNSGPAYDSNSFMSTNTYNLNLGGTTVHANGLNQDQATKVVSDSFNNQINMAYGAIDDGVDH